MSYKEFTEGIGEGKIIGYRCEHCRRFSLKEGRCPFCGSPIMVETEMPRKGRIVARTEISVAPGGFSPPYTVALIELSNGLRIMGVFEGEGEKVEFSEARENSAGIALVFR